VCGGTWTLRRTTKPRVGRPIAGLQKRGDQLKACQWGQIGLVMTTLKVVDTLRRPPSVIIVLLLPS
jgi:hypothetical protein